MNEREKEILTEVAKALPHMSDFDKGYMLCMAERSAMENSEKEEQKPELMSVGQ